MINSTPHEELVSYIKENIGDLIEKQYELKQ